MQSMASRLARPRVPAGDQPLRPMADLLALAALGRFVGRAATSGAGLTLARAMLLTPVVRLPVMPMADLTATATLILAGITLALAVATIALVIVTRQAAERAWADAREELDD